MANKSERKWLGGVSRSMAFIAFFAGSHCLAQNSAAAPAQSGNETLKKSLILVDLSGRQSSYFFTVAKILWPQDANVSARPSTPAAQVKKSGSMADRVKDRDRKFPMRDNRTAIEIVKHVNGIFGGLEQGAGSGFGVELTTAGFYSGNRISGHDADFQQALQKVGGRGVYIQRSVDEKTHADFLVWLPAQDQRQLFRHWRIYAAERQNKF